MGTLTNPAKTMKRAIRHASRDANRPILRGVMLTAEGEAVATDSYRLSVERNVWSGDEIVVPYSIACDLAHVKASVKSAEITSDGNTVKATLPDGTEFADDVPGGKYPKWKALFEGAANTVAYVKRAELLGIAREHVKAKADVVVLNVNSGTLGVTNTEQSVGAKVFDKVAEGNNVRIGFNPKFLRDALNSIECEYVAIRIEKSIRPAVFADCATNNVQVLVMPVRLDDEPSKKPELKRAPEKIDRDEVKQAVYHLAIDRAANDADSRVKGGNTSEHERTLDWQLRKDGRLVNDKEYAGFTTWKLDGEFLCCIEQPYSKRKIHLHYPMLKPKLHNTDKAAEHRTSFAEKFAEKCEEKTGIKLDVKPIPGGGLAASVAKTEPKKEDNDMELKKRIEELEAELTKRNAELETVWKENEQLKRSKPKPEPKPEPKADMPTAVTLETMQEWCEGKGLIATQKREGTCIWVEGDSKPYADELKELGFRFAKKRKSWYFTAAAR